MGVVLGIDYGGKRCGLAISDSSKMIGSPLETVPTHLLLNRLKELAHENNLDDIVIGMPKGLDGKETDASQMVSTFIRNFQKSFPEIPIHTEDERFTSKLALDSMIQGNMSKKKRREKGNIDKVSAAIILQSYLDKLP